MIAAAGYQHIRMYDLASGNPNPVINYEGVSKNVTGLGFQVSNYCNKQKSVWNKAITLAYCIFQEEGKWMYTGGEDLSARIWDLRYK